MYKYMYMYMCMYVYVYMYMYVCMCMHMYMYMYMSMSMYMCNMLYHIISYHVMSYHIISYYPDGGRAARRVRRVVVSSERSASASKDLPRLFLATVLRRRLFHP